MGHEYTVQMDYYLKLCSNGTFYLCLCSWITSRSHHLPVLRKAAFHRVCECSHSRSIGGTVEVCGSPSVHIWGLCIGSSCLCYPLSHQRCTVQSHHILPVVVEFPFLGGTSDLGETEPNTALIYISLVWRPNTFKGFMCLSFLCSYMHFIFLFLYYYEEYHWDLDGNFIDSIDSFWKYGQFPSTSI